MRVPPWPSLAEVNWLAMYWPSSVMLAVLIPSVTVSVPLKLLPASVKLTLVLDRRRWPIAWTKGSLLRFAERATSWALVFPGPEGSCSTSRAREPIRSGRESCPGLAQQPGRSGRPHVGSELYVGLPLTGALATRDDGSRYAMISGFEPSQGLVKVKRAVDVPGG
jgi:hypothetical protein